MIDFAFDAARATKMVKITAITVTTIAYASIAPNWSVVPKISLNKALMASFQANAATKPNAAAISAAILSRISNFNDGDFFLQSHYLQNRYNLSHIKTWGKNSKIKF